MSSPLRLGQLLLREGLVSRLDVDLALSEQKAGSAMPLGRLLVEQGAIDEATLAHVLAHQFGLPLIDLEREAPESDALSSLPRDTALKLQALPLRHDCDRLVVVVAEPPTRGLRQALAQCTHESVRFAVAPADHLAHAVTVAYPDVAHHNGDPAAPAPEPLALPAAPSVDDTADTAAGSVPRPAGATGDNVLRWLLTRTLGTGATSVHLEGDPEGLWVRYVGSSSRPESLRLPTPAGATLVSRVLRAAGLDPDVASPQAGAFRVDDMGLAGPVRVTSARTRMGCKVVVRLEPGSAIGFGLEWLGLEPEHVDASRAAVGAPRGLVVVAGPPGSGRSTTVRALLAEIDPIARSVVTIEQPPGALMPRVAQLRLDGATGLTAESALDAASALDADVIAIDASGESDLFATCVQLALTSRLVLLVVEAPDAWGALDQLTSSVDPFLVAAAVTLVVVQRDGGRVETLIVSETVREQLMQRGGQRIDG